VSCSCIPLFCHPQAKENLVGYELFKDQDRLQTTFIEADIFDDTSKLMELEGKINIIYAGAFFHLFGLEEQKRIATRVVQLLVSQPGSMVCGQQSGNEKPGEYGRKGDTSRRTSFRHSSQSWKGLWELGCAVTRGSEPGTYRSGPHRSGPSLTFRPTGQV
jgi:hypothetical protein